MAVKWTKEKPPQAGDLSINILYTIDALIPISFQSALPLSLLDHERTR